jgi:hypothetical protein
MGPLSIFSQFDIDQSTSSLFENFFLDPDLKSEREHDLDLEQTSKT